MGGGTQGREGAPGVSNVTTGGVWTMNAPAEDGRDCVAVRLSCEWWERLDEDTRARISGLFEGFCQNVEDLF